MKQFPIIYKRNSNKSINQWQILVEGNSYYSEEGILNGKITKSKSTIVKGKNIGRSNEQLMRNKHTNRLKVNSKRK